MFKCFLKFKKNISYFPYVFMFQTLILGRLIALTSYFCKKIMNALMPLIHEWR